MNHIEKTISSLEVADMVSKQHKELLRDIRKYSAVLTSAKLRSLDFFVPDEYVDQKNEHRPCYRLTKQGCELVANKLTGDKGIEFAAKYVSKFNDMENHIKRQSIKIPESPREALKLMFEFQEEVADRVEAVESDVEYLKDNQLLTEPDYRTISTMVRNKIRIICTQQHLNSKAKTELFKDLNSSIKRITGAAARNRIKAKQFDEVVKFINNWMPSSATMTIIDQMDLLEEEQEDR